MSSSITHVISSTSAAILSHVLNANPRGLTGRRERGGEEGGKETESTRKRVVKKAKRPRVLLPERMNYSAEDEPQNVISKSSPQRGLVTVSVCNKVGKDDSWEENVQMFSEAKVVKPQLFILSLHLTFVPTMTCKYGAQKTLRSSICCLKAPA